MLLRSSKNIAQLQIEHDVWQPTSDRPQQTNPLL